MTNIKITKAKYLKYCIKNMKQICINYKYKNNRINIISNNKNKKHKRNSKLVK